jgi:uncharacterized delta-60 repeat protein
MPMRCAPCYVRGVLRTARAFATTLAVTSVLCAAAPAWSAPGDVDTSYGQGGAAIAEFGHNAFGNALVVQPDGKVVVVGTGISTFATTSDVVLARFTSQGALDSSFGAGSGKVQPDFGHDETGYGAVLQPDGKILVGGDTSTTGGGSDLLVTRFDADGSLDATFGSGGAAHPDFGGLEFGRAIALAPDGSIYIAGYTGSSLEDSVVARLTNPLGTPDTTFASHTGAFVGADIPGSSTPLAAAALAPNGVLFTAGAEIPQPGAASSFLTEQIQPSSFGIWPLTLPGTGAATAIAVQPDGKQVIAGYVTSAAGGENFAVMRAEGVSRVVDMSFGTGGVQNVDLGGLDVAKAIAVQADGKIVVVGTSTVGSSSRIGVVRLLANGQRDPSFGQNGISLIDLGKGKLEGNAVGLQANGQIVIGGTITPTGGTKKDLLAIRLQGDSSSTTTGGTSGGTSNGSSSGGGATGGGGGGQSATTHALASKLALSSATFAAQASGPSASATGTHGTSVRFQLNVAAEMSFGVERVTVGRRLTHKGKPVCAAQTSSDRSKPRCPRLVSLKGRFARAGVAGTNSFHFSGRLSGRALAPGNYRLLVTPIVNGTRAATDSIAFTIIG